MDERKEQSFGPGGGGAHPAASEELDEHSEYGAIGRSRVIDGFFAEIGEFPSFVEVHHQGIVAESSSTNTSC